ncbi:metallophosphoesterase [Campylobacter concisus]|uniref:metallophosphoesterase n=1 Tax=Campylobacter concisus TaxID=199 RepID=UPI000AD71B6B|nr:metallophosphoesterase [Campylobacter concisus]
MGLFRIIIGAFIFSVLTNLYSYKRFIKKVSFFTPHLKKIRIFFYIISVLEFVFVLQLRFSFLNIELYLIAGTLIGFSLFLFGVSLFYDVVRSICSKAHFNPTRRKFIKFCFDVTFVIFVIACFLKGIFNALMPPKIRQVDIKIKNLQSSLKIAMITDVHIGEFLQKDFIKKLVNDINLANPDIVVIVGDLVDVNAAFIEDFLEPLKSLKSTYGTFYVPGNHEYYHGIDGILEKISSLGIEILGNKNKKIASINLAGVYDLAGIRFKHLEPNLDEALTGRDPSLPTILLSHQPKFIKTMQKDVDLVLCGHTHAGQIFPFGLLVLLDQGFYMGFIRLMIKCKLMLVVAQDFGGLQLGSLPPARSLY